jgi:hypothetical protein
MRKYKVNFYAYYNDGINNTIEQKIFFSNTIKFININPFFIGQPIINNLYKMKPDSILTIKGNKNEIDTTTYNINSGKAIFILSKDYE